MKDEPLRVLSLGAGVQSSTLLLMSLDGELPPLVAAIFSDTGWEPAAVYRHLGWLEAEAARRGLSVRRVSAGNIRQDFRRALDAGTRYVQPPTFIRNLDGSTGHGRRQCTKEYKLEPIRREVGRILKEQGRTRRPGTVEAWMGISLDEAHRMKDSKVAYIVNAYPLIERRMSRHDCLRWLEAKGYPIPPRSSCIGCPFHGDAYWREMRDERPEEWRQAVEFDRLIRKGGGRGEMVGEHYLHRSLVALDMVDLRVPEEKGQQAMFEDGFGNECEGLCGG